jgi:TPR repeat protein
LGARGAGNRPMTRPVDYKWRYDAPRQSDATMVFPSFTAAEARQSCLYGGRVVPAMGVAYRYEHGFKAAVDLPKAMEWYRISAEAGYVIAQTSLGELYESAPGLVNLDEASRWYRAAADTWGPAMCDLGRLYEAGKGVPQDYTDAAGWYRRAVDKAGAP